MNNQTDAWYLEQLAENGMTVEPGSDQLKADLSKVGDIMLDEWLERAGAEGHEIIDTYRN